MENERPPYWEWPLDRLNVLILSAAVTLLLGLSLLSLAMQSQPIIPPADVTATAVARQTVRPDTDGTTVPDDTGDTTLTPSPEITGTRPGDPDLPVFALTLPVTSTLAITDPAGGSLLVTPLLRIEGYAPTGQTVLGFDGQNSIEQTVADAAGLWSLELGAPLAEGRHVLWAALLDANQAPFVRSEIISVTVETRAAPVIVEPADGSAVSAFQAQNVRGTGAPDGRIQVFLDDIPLGETIADASGAWQFTAAQPLLLGMRRLRADLLDDDGRTLAVGIPIQVLILP
jgi:hypothetical protein